MLGNLLSNWQRGQPWDLPQVLVPIGGSSRQCAYRRERSRFLNGKRAYRIQDWHGWGYFSDACLLIFMLRAIHILLQAACSTGGMLTEITLRFVGKETYGKVQHGVEKRAWLDAWWIEHHSLVLVENMWKTIENNHGRGIQTERTLADWNGLKSWWCLPWCILFCALYVPFNPASW